MTNIPDKNQVNSPNRFRDVTFFICRMKGQNQATSMLAMLDFLNFIQ